MKPLNNPLAIALCENMKKDMDLLIQHIHTSNIPTAYDTFTSCEELLLSFKVGKYDLIFFDIYMDGMSGIEAASKIREIDTTIILAFTTTSIEHTLESYRLRAPIYIEKPIPLRDVQAALEMALERRKSFSYINLLINGIYRDISLESILYFEINNHAVNVNTTTEKLRTSQSLKLSDIETLLPNTFFRCHHSYIVHLKYVLDIDKELKIFIMQNGDKIHIKYPLLKRAVKIYEDYLFSKIGGLHL